MIHYGWCSPAFAKFALPLVLMFLLTKVEGSRKSRQKKMLAKFEEEKPEKAFPPGQSELVIKNKSTTLYGTTISGKPLTHTWKFAPVEDYYKKQTQATKDDPFLTQVASVANRVYEFASPVAGWKLMKHYDVGMMEEKGYHQNVAIYRQDVRDKCILVFEGHSGLADVKTEFQTGSETWCDFKGVQSGFVMRLNHFMASSRYSEFMSYLADKQQCPGGVISTGHSLGGALANLMGACANRRGLFKVAGIYTFGAPGMSTVQITNDLSEEGCFPGARVHTSSRLTQDPIAFLGRTKGFLHPKLLEMHIQINGQKVTIEEHACNSTHEQDYPRIRDKVPNIREHFMGIYIRRLLMFNSATPTNELEFEYSSSSPIFLGPLTSLLCFIIF